MDLTSTALKPSAWLTIIQAQHIAEKAYIMICCSEYISVMARHVAMSQQKFILSYVYSDLTKEHETSCASI